MPLTAKFAHQEEMQGIQLFPDAYLRRSGRTMDDLGLRNDHYFNGTHFTLKWEPRVTRESATLVRETIEECIIVLPKNVDRIQLLCANNAHFFKCIYEAVRLPVRDSYLAFSLTTSFSHADLKVPSSPLPLSRHAP